MPALALTDSGNLFGSLEFSDYASSLGVQPIIGCNIMMSYNGDSIGELVLLVKDQIGYNNIVNLVSNSFKDSQSNKVNRVDLEKLIDLKDGIIVLTGGHDGFLSQLLLGNVIDYGIIDKLLLAFNGNLYVELQRHGMEEEKIIEKTLVNFAYEKDLPLVATNDVLFAKKNDFLAHDVLSCISDGNYIAQEGRKMFTEEHYFKSSDEMYRLFKDIPEAVSNTVLIAQRCSFMPETRKPMLPHFPCSSGKNESQELISQAINGLDNRLKSKSLSTEQVSKYYERLHYELDIIISMDYAGYFLIVSDFICWSKRNDIMVGPGRGSGAGSLVAWSLQITDLDPIEFGLIFERFLNPDRISMPDFDIDFCQEKRDYVIEYVRKKYGYVAHIITFGKLQAKAVLRDVGRVMQMPYFQVDRICKMIPHNPVKPVTLSEAIEMDKNLQKEQDDDETVAKLLEISLKLEGLYRHVSIHAAGIVICDRELEELLPLYYDSTSSLPITQYNMKYTEKAGLVKFDFLGLRTLTVINQICHLVNRGGHSVDISRIPLNDRKTYEMLSAGDSVGVFQLESSGMREVISKLKPDNINDIIALISLYRPGPMDNISIYIARKHGFEKPDYIHPILEDVLRETFGVIIYQEQVMEIAKIMAGYSLGEADLLRRAMGKKIKEEMDNQRRTFINGAVSNGIEEEKASYIFDLVAKFAGYGFNKSHAAAYALISYQTAYLKANYTLEFFTASMNLDIMDKDKLEMLCHQAKLHGIEILPPDINSSKVLFTIEGASSIRYALGALKNVGQHSAKEIVDDVAYKDIWDFIDRVSTKCVHKRILESIIKAGVLDSIHSNRKQLFESVFLFLDIIEYNKYNANFNQFSLFNDKNHYKLSETDDWTKEEKLNNEFSSIGFYLNHHPMENYKYLLDKLNIGFIHYDDKSSYNNVIVGIISNVKVRSTNKDKFAVVTLSDPFNIHEIVFYNGNIIEDNKDLFTTGASVIIEMDNTFYSASVRLLGKNIYSFENKISSIIKTMVIHVNAKNSVVIKELSSLLQNRGSTVVLIDLVLPNDHVTIQLPNSFLVTPLIFAQIFKLNWVKDIEINSILV
ncbi:DNA polymerase III subunit alpha [Ehrlichia chaffeensis str. Heartland]|nr:DNA polymerase III subunit alpha [Ehrlichia chaffeensis str. Heartland]AHX06302.1 DNA polymerase III subunit alpha [Ehrlichia chaffeensis str. Liberty]AHX07794.1 DNA polymerase III subunit alpha [Ehrlichia chaffeensis str. Osceola]AHX08515.1 DNA polymerase III subunit alpha [Ehrlichia chaffeensis str. Saint Vincent]AHX09356.1 DNA polymerase III subunit alpha [Ehrlichia chaffeensis str. Wakulla]